MNHCSVGVSFPKVDALAKATGAAKFAADFALPRLLQARVVRSPLPHARVAHVDTSKAIKVPGVKTVVTAEDTPKIKFGMTIPDELLLAVHRVRYVGDEVAAVAAIDMDVAEEAAQLVRVEYEELPAVFDPNEATMPGAVQLHDHAPNNIAMSLKYERGNVEKGFGQADLVMEENFTPSQAHQCYMEPVAIVASWDESARLTVWGPFQSVFLAKELLATSLQIDAGRIRVIQTFVGGAFGGKLDLPKAAAIASLLARKSGRPVRVVNTREEEFIAGRPSTPALIHQKLGLRKDGAMVAKESRLICNNGAYNSLGPALTKTMAMHHECLYRIPNVKAEARLVYTNRTPTGAYRGFGNRQGAFAFESLIDMAAVKLGMDPGEFRFKNSVESGDVAVHGYRISSCGFKECVGRALKKSGWRQKKINKRKNVGIGMAGAIHVTGNRGVFDYDGSSAIIRVDDDGRVRLFTGEGDVGQGSRTILAQIVAEELGVPFHWVEIGPADTDLSPFGLGPYADRVTFIAGNAAKLAAADAKRQVIAIASEMLEANPEDLEVKKGKIYVRGFPEKALDFQKLVRAGLIRKGGSPIIAKGSYDPPTEMLDPINMYGHVSPTYAFGVNIAEVEVDPETGQVKILDMTCADDCGFAINPMAAEGQVHGAAAQGIGFTLMEEMAWDGGRLVNPSMADYKIPAAADLPQITSILVESNDPHGPFGAKSIGELPIVPVPAAIANAIFDAVGVRITNLPITAEKVLASLKEARRK